MRSMSKRLTMSMISAPAISSGPYPCAAAEIRGPVVVVRRVGCCRGPDADTLDPAIRPDALLQRAPPRLGRRCVGRRQPAAVHAPGQREGEHRRGRRFKVAVRTVDQLVPEPRVSLRRGRSLGSLAEDVENRRPPRVVRGQDAEELRRRHDRPAGPAAPVEFRVGVHPLEPGVVVQPPRLVEQQRREPEHLSGRIVVVGPFAGQVPHLREERHAHVEVVHPDRDRPWTRAGQRAIRHAAHLARDEICHDIDGLPVPGIAFLLVGLDQRRADRAAVVQLAHVEQVAQAPALRAELPRLGAEVVEVPKDEVEHAQGVRLIAEVAGDVGHVQHARERHAVGVRPVVELAVAVVDPRALDRAGQVRHHLAARGVDDLARGGPLVVLAHAV